MLQRELCLSSARLAEEAGGYFVEQDRMLSGGGLAPLASDHAYPRAPVVMPAAFFEQTQDHLRQLVDLMSEVPRLLFDSDLSRMLELYRLPDRYAAVMGDPAGTVVSRFARPDGVVCNGVFKVIETNIDTGIGGIFETDLLCQMHRGSPAMREVASRWRLELVSPLDAFTRFFVRSGGSWAFWDIDDRADEPFLVEMAVEMVKVMRASGAKVCFATSSEIEPRDGRILAGGVEVDRLYRGFACTHLLTLFEEITGVIERVPRFDEVVEGQLGSHLVENKINLALVSDPANRHLLSSSQRQLVDAVVPWTRRVRDMEVVLPDGDRGSLPAFLDQERERMVIKRGVSFRGRDTFIGKETPAVEWSEVIARALADDDWIAQELLESDKIVLPYIIDGVHQEYAPRMTFAFFLIGDVLGGGGARTSIPGGPLVLSEPEVNCGIVPVARC